MKIQIKCRFSGRVLFEHDVYNNNIKRTAEAAVKAGASLVGAYLVGASLDGASLVGAYLDGASLVGAYLVGASLVGASLDGASLNGAYLVGKRPIFQLGPIGSRCSYLVAFLTSAGLKISAGCFFGSLEEFAKLVDAEHGCSVHGDEYRAAIAMIESHANLWMPKA